MSPAISEPCTVENMPEAEYHGDPVVGGSLSYTGMKELLKTPAHFRHYMDAPRVDKPAFDAGHVVHALVLGTDLNVVEIPGTALSSSGTTGTRAAREFIAEARAEGLIPMKPGELKPLETLAEAVLAHPLARTLFEADGPTELSMFAPDPASGVWIRGRADKAATIDSETLLVDLKTTPSADPEEFNRQAITKYGYYLQAYVYTWLYHTLNPEQPTPDFRIVAVAKTEPHLVTVHALDWEYLQLGKAHMRRAVERFAEGIATGDWPGYPNVLNEQAPPMWLADELELQL